MARSKADYPDWVMKHKTKGTYINFVKPDKYYLYAAHSVRDKQSGRIIRVCDGYIGRITEKDGLILSKKKRPASDSSPLILEYGLSFIILRKTDRILSHFRDLYPENGTLIYVCAALVCIFSCFSEDLFRHSYLASAFPDLEWNNPPSDAAVNSCREMIQDELDICFGDDLHRVKAYASLIGIIRTGQSSVLSRVHPEALELFEKYGIRMEDTDHGKD